MSSPYPVTVMFMDDEQRVSEFEAESTQQILDRYEAVDVDGFLETEIADAVVDNRRTTDISPFGVEVCKKRWLLVASNENDLEADLEELRRDI